MKHKWRIFVGEKVRIDVWYQSCGTNFLAITGQPADAETALGDNFCVTVEAQGDGLKYQWYFKNAGSPCPHCQGRS